MIHFSDRKTKARCLRGCVLIARTSKILPAASIQWYCTTICSVPKFCMCADTHRGVRDNFGGILGIEGQGAPLKSLIHRARILIRSRAQPPWIQPLFGLPLPLFSVFSRLCLPPSPLSSKPLCSLWESWGEGEDRVEGCGWALQALKV